MIIECTTCPVRGHRCDDCVVTALRSLPVLVLEPASAASSPDLPLDAAERRAVDLFVAAGLIGAEQAATLTARREPAGARAVG